MAGNEKKICSKCLDELKSPEKDGSRDLRKKISPGKLHSSDVPYQAPPDLFATRKPDPNKFQSKCGSHELIPGETDLSPKAESLTQKIMSQAGLKLMNTHDGNRADVSPQTLLEEVNIGVNEEIKLFAIILTFLNLAFSFYEALDFYTRKSEEVQTAFRQSTKFFRFPDGNVKNLSETKVAFTPIVIQLVHLVAAVNGLLGSSFESVKSMMIFLILSPFYLLTVTTFKLTTLPKNRFQVMEVRKKFPQVPSTPNMFATKPRQRLMSRQYSLIGLEFSTAPTPMKRNVQPRLSTKNPNWRERERNVANGDSCQWCNKDWSFSNSTARYKHLTRECSSRMKRKGFDFFPCSECDAGFLSVRGLKNHQVKHRKTQTKTADFKKPSTRISLANVSKLPYAPALKEKSLKRPLEEAHYTLPKFKRRKPLGL